MSSRILFGLRLSGVTFTTELVVVGRDGSTLKCPPGVYAELIHGEYGARVARAGCCTLRVLTTAISAILQGAASLRPSPHLVSSGATTGGSVQVHQLRFASPHAVACFVGERALCASSLSAFCPSVWHHCPPGASPTALPPQSQLNAGTHPVAPVEVKKPRQQRTDPPVSTPSDISGHR